MLLLLLILLTPDSSPSHPHPPIQIAQTLQFQVPDGGACLGAVLRSTLPKQVRSVIAVVPVVVVIVVVVAVGVVEVEVVVVVVVVAAVVVE